jgi:hypothetical protein
MYYIFDVFYLVSWCVLFVRLTLFYSAFERMKNENGALKSGTKIIMI